VNGYRLYRRDELEALLRAAAAVRRIAAAVGSAEDAPWWGQCVRRLGVPCSDYALGLLQETRDRQSVGNPGGLPDQAVQGYGRRAGDRFAVALAGCPGNSRVRPGRDDFNIG